MESLCICAGRLRVANSGGFGEAKRPAGSAWSGGSKGLHGARYGLVASVRFGRLPTLGVELGTEIDAIKLHAGEEGAAG